MIDSILSGVLALGLLLGGTAAFGLEMSRAGQSETNTATATATVTLPTVVVTGHRSSAATLLASR